MGTEGPDPGVSQGRSPGSASCWLWDLQPVISVPLSLICFLCKTSTLAILTVRICRQEPEMKYVSASLGAGIKCSVLGGYSHLLTQRTWAARRGPKVKLGLRGRESLASPQTTHKQGKDDGSPKDALRTFRDTQAPVQGPDSPAKTLSPALLCRAVGEGCPPLASGPRSEKPDNKRALTAGFPRASVRLPARI